VTTTAALFSAALRRAPVLERLGAVKALVPASLVVALAALGCGRAAGEAARFTGHLGRVSLGGVPVRDVAVRPPGYETLGSVVATCRVDEGVVAIDDGWLSDVDCSDRLLTDAIRAKAAAVGGAVLVGRTCTAGAEPRGELLGSTLHTCSAKVAAPALTAGLRDAGRRDPAALRAAPGDASDADPASARDRPWAAEVSYPNVEDAWRVAIRFAPADPGAEPHRSRPADRVAELSIAPVGRVVVGDIVARCRGRCDRGAVRYAVRATAARVGATDVVGIACVRGRSGWLCTGQATRPEADPETTAAAR
jgi:hypothetical protein